MTEFDRPVTLEELRANGVPFHRSIQRGRYLELAEIIPLLELGGLGVGTFPLAAEERREWGTD